MKDLIIDNEIHTLWGFTILSKEEVESRPKIAHVEKWPRYREFCPPGITQEEAYAAMQKCKNRD